MSGRIQHSNALIQALLDPLCYDTPTPDCQLVETHISWVILTGRYAYKFKKPVNLGFLDFSTLEKRRHFCEEELRLNRRLAPNIYLAVVPICGSAKHPEIAGRSAAIEYAVKMVQFPQHAQLDRMLEQGDLKFGHMDAIARMVARFHQTTTVAGTHSEYGNAQHIAQPVVENFAQIGQHLPDSLYQAKLDALHRWSMQACEALTLQFAQRKRQGYVRECHGDMHLRNLAWVEDAPLAFDCIEFDPNLRWIDVISEVAFLVMDLQDRGQPALAQRFLNSYLEQTGDYAALELLPFYLTYRAMVRAKVTAIRLQQTGLDASDKKAAKEEFVEYLTLAQSYTETTKPCLMITRGLSASGKSTVTQLLLQQLPAIRIRSDIERKRLFKVPFSEAGEESIYTAEATEKTYIRLTDIAADVLDAGCNVIIDAVNGSSEHRQAFQALAEQRQIPYVILDFIATPDTLRQRIIQRKGDVSDAGLAVLESQLSNWQGLAEDEAVFAINVATDHAVDIGALDHVIKQRCINHCKQPAS